MDELILRATAELLIPGLPENFPDQAYDQIPVTKTIAEFAEIITTQNARYAREAQLREALWWAGKLALYHAYKGGGKNPHAAEINGRLAAIQAEEGKSK